MSSQSQTPSSTALPQASAYTPVQGARWMAKKGLRITPLRGKAPFLQAWQASATGDLAQVNAWQESWPDINFGCVAKKSEFWMLDEDVVGVVARFTAETGIAMDQHFRVESSVGAGRSHWYFRACAESDKLLSNITQDQFKDGAASVRVNNEQCVCPFSVHPERKTPYLPVDLHAEIKVAPTEFIKWILDQRVKSSAEKASVDEDFIVPDGQRDNFLISRAGKLREAGAEYEEIYSALSRDNEKHCQPPKEEADIERISKSACRYKKGTAYTTTIGGLLPGQNVVPSAQPKQAPASSIEVLDDESLAKMKAPKGKKATQILQYPLHVWAGTLYSEFAEICGQNNKIAPEFFVEALKTTVGAIAGHRIQTKEARGQQPARFYTVLIGPGGGGKSTAVKWAIDMFIGSGLLPENSQNMALVNVGAMKGNYSSATGLIEKGYFKSSRLFQVYDEITTLIEKFGITGSGDTYLDQVNSMYEAGYVPQGITKGTKDAVYRGAVDHTLLGVTTEVKWKNAFRRSAVEKSGFFQRLNIITNDSEDRVADLNAPDLTAIREKLIRKIQPLEYQQVEVEILPDAKKLLDDWFESKQESWRSLSTDVTGRLQVLVKRNLDHLAWLLNGDEGTLDPEHPEAPITAICDEEIMQRAIDLSEYQEQARLIHQPIIAENDFALMEGLIVQHFRKNDAPITRNNLYNALHAERFGSKNFESVIKELLLDGVIDQKVLPNEGRKGRKTRVIVWVGDED